MRYSKTFTAVTVAVALTALTGCGGEGGQSAGRPRPAEGG